MKSSHVVPVLAALAVTVGAVPAQAHDKIYTVVLAGAKESPPNGSKGAGVAIVSFDLDLVTMRVQATFADLSGDTTAAHIHCCTAVPGAGNVGVATQLPTFTGFPLGTRFGAYDHTFDMAVASSYNPTFISNNGGSVSTALTALLNGIDAGSAYLNFHSSFAPGGEIRGFLSAVPEPRSYAMMLAGLGLLGWLARQRRSPGTPG